MTLVKRYNRRGQLLSVDAKRTLTIFLDSNPARNVSRIEKSQKIGLKLTISYMQRFLRRDQVVARES